MVVWAFITCVGLKMFVGRIWLVMIVFDFVKIIMIVNINYTSCSISIRHFWLSLLLYSLYSYYHSYYNSTPIIVTVISIWSVPTSSFYSASQSTNPIKSITNAFNLTNFIYSTCGRFISTIMNTFISYMKGCENNFYKSTIIGWVTISI